jgi:hypothetical protein
VEDWGSTSIVGKETGCERCGTGERQYDETRPSGEMTRNWERKLSKSPSN